MKPQKLLQNNSTLEDLLFWIKQFYLSKFANFSKDNVPEDFQLPLYTQKMSRSTTDTIESVIGISKDAQDIGIKSLKKINIGIEKFYIYIQANQEQFKSITDIDISILQYISNIAYQDEKDSIKDYIFDTARGLFNFIDDNTLEGEYLFHISKGIDGKAIKRKNSRSFKKSPLFLEEDEMHHFNKNLMAMKHSESEKMRDILIGRLFLFTGITVSELRSLEDDVFKTDEKDKNTLWVSIKGKGAKKRSIPVPRRKLIVYINSYLKERGDSSCDLLFCISESRVIGIVKNQLESAGFDKERTTATVLRNTYGIFLYRRMILDGKHDPIEEIRMLMGHANKQTTQDLVKSSSPKLLSAADMFNEFE